MQFAKACGDCVRDVCVQFEPDACLKRHALMQSQGHSRTRRWRMLIKAEKWLEPAMVLLGLVWLLLTVLEFTIPRSRGLQTASTFIWIVFAIEFAARFVIAPDKLRYLARNWLSLISLALPALRIVRFVRALRLIRATRGLRLVRLLTSMNRGLRALGTAMGQRGAGYVGALTIAVVLAGAAGMLAFEGREPNGAFSGYGEALWWTAMLLTTLGSEFWPATLEGRILTVLLAVYAVGVFGYLAAALASVFVGRQSADADAAKATAALAAQVSELRREMQMLRDVLDQKSGAR